jgi:hypothetical protein
VEQRRIWFVCRQTILSGTIFEVHWDEPSNTFSLLNPANGELKWPQTAIGQCSIAARKGEPVT